MCGIALKFKFRVCNVIWGRLYIMFYLFLFLGFNLIQKFFWVYVMHECLFVLSCEKERKCEFMIYC